MKKNKNEKNNSVFIIILLVVVIVLVLLFPKIYNFLETLKMPKLGKTEIVEEKKNGPVEDEVLEKLHYPNMRNSIYDSNTYYSLDKFTINNMSNNDILSNAFLDMYEGNITNYTGYVTCTNASKQFNEDYLTLRIKNILGKSVNYKLDNFYVPEDSTSSFKGEWKYDGANKRYIYNGLCTTKATNIKYYNLEQLVKAEYNDKDIIVYKYVGFAKMEGNTYTIYSDPTMNNVLVSGETSNIEELTSAFQSLNKKDKKLYKYTFKNNLCSYNEYCLYESEWANGLQKKS